MRGRRARDLWLNYQFGLHEEPATDWQGPGRAVFYEHNLTEGNERAFYAEWQRLSQVPSFGRLLMAAPMSAGDLPARNRGKLRQTKF